MDNAIDSSLFSYFKNIKAMVSEISDLALDISSLLQPINESQLGFRIRSSRTGQVETFVYIDTKRSTANDREVPEIQAWTFRPRSHKLQESINLLTIYND